MGIAARAGSRHPVRLAIGRGPEHRGGAGEGRLGDRNPLWLALLAVVCGGVGLSAGISPKLGFEVTLGLAFFVAVLGNLLVGMVLFTVLSFLEVINSGGAALSFIKLAGLVLFVSWYAASATQGGRESRSLAAEQPWLVFAVVAFLSWSVLSLLWAQSRGAAVTGTERYLLNILLLPIVFGAARRRDRFLWIVGAFIFGADLSAVFGFLASGGGRLTGGIGDPNELASVLIAAFVLSLPLIVASRPGSLRRFAALTGCGLAAVGILYTDSRGGLIALGCTLLAGLVFGGRWRYRALLVFVATGLAVGAYFFAIAPSSAQQHLSSTNSSGRADLWKVGLRMFSAHPLIGVGSGNFQTAAVRYVQVSGSLTRADLIVDVPHVAHNMYLQVADELGLPGLLALLAVAGATLGAAFRAARRYERAGDVLFEMMSRALMLAIVGALVADVFLSGEYSKQLWLLLALPAPLLALAPPAQA